MARYDYGMNRYPNRQRGRREEPYGGARGGSYARDYSGQRPWTGGYREGYQGGSGGVPTGGPRGARGYGQDFWWIGEHEMRRRGYAPTYDEAYRRFDQESHPRISPVGGMYHSMGGRYAYDRPPRELRDDHWFSDWTRWF